MENVRFTYICCDAFGTEKQTDRGTIITVPLRPSSDKVEIIPETLLFLNVFFETVFSIFISLFLFLYIYIEQVESFTDILDMPD